MSYEIRQPRVGDQVVITLSSTNWNEKMDQFIGEICTIKEEINGKDEYEYKLTHIDPYIQTRLNDWHWVYTHGHFRIDNNMVKKLNFRMPKLKEEV